MALEIYTKNNCVYCERAKEFLAAHEIPFKVYLIGEDVSLDWVREAFPLQKTVPIIKMGQRIVGGYSELVVEVGKNPHFGKDLLLG